MSKRPRVLIAGSGSAGLFCAWALADKADVTVIEAGPDPGHPVPSDLLRRIFHLEYDWGYRDAQTRQALVTGRLVGGTSLKALGALRGDPADYDRWGPNWTWDECLPAFRALEADVDFGNAPFHGGEGPIPISRAAFSPFDSAFRNICLKAGYVEVPDFNVPGAHGVGPWPTSMRDGLHIGTLAGVMPLLRGRIRLRADSLVEKVVLNGNRAVGLQIQMDGRSETLSADHTVLAAGAYGSPILLHRSGLPLPGLGLHISNHTQAHFRVRCRRRDWADQLPPLGALLRVGLDGDPSDLIHVYALQTCRYFTEADPAELFVQAVMMATRSQGMITWVNGNPQIRHCHLSDPTDVVRLSRIVDHVVGLLELLVEENVLEPLPKDAWWRRRDREPALRELEQYEYHPTGTCGIGRVVDERLRVRGVDCLSIADASIMPAIPQANTNLPAMMIGVRAGQMLAEEL